MLHYPLLGSKCLWYSRNDIHVMGDVVVASRGLITIATGKADDMILFSVDIGCADGIIHSMVALSSARVFTISLFYISSLSKPAAT